jgi:hypothetical protein
MSRARGRTKRVVHPVTVQSNGTVMVENSQDVALVSSAQVVANQLRNPIITYKQWQDEAWDFYDSGGEYQFAMTWLSNALSRVRLTAAKLLPGGEEPEIIAADAEGADKDVSDLVSRLGHGIGGQAAIMKMLGLQMSVPGEGYLVGTVENGVESWVVRSADDIKILSTRTFRNPDGSQRRTVTYQMQVEEGAWLQLPPETLVTRIWEPHPRRSYEATSASKSALPILREIDLYNKHIVATLLSRLAFNGFLLIPEEVTFPVKEEFKSAPDPFIAELISIASRAIKNPGTAAAAIPIPLRMKSEFIEKMVHLAVSAGVDDKLIAARDRAIKRLAATLNMPQEVVLGMADVNHWTAWQLEESAIKIHIAPPVETIVTGLTKAYLYPMMTAAGMKPMTADGARYVIWYDTSELTAKPDLGDKAEVLHDKHLISDEAYRREAGFDEGDKPDDQELQTQLIREWFTAVTAANPELVMEIIGKLSTPVTGIEIPEPPSLPGEEPGAPTPGNEPDKDSKPVTGPPERQAEPPPTGPTAQMASGARELEPV